MSRARRLRAQGVTHRVTCDGMMWHYEQGEKVRSEWCVLRWFAWQSGSPCARCFDIFYFLRLIAIRWFTKRQRDLLQNLSMDQSLPELQEQRLIANLADRRLASNLRAEIVRKGCKATCALEMIADRLVFENFGPQLQLEAPPRPRCLAAVRSLNACLAGFATTSGVSPTSMPAAHELLTLVAGELDLDSLVNLAAASTACLLAADGELLVALKRSLLAVAIPRGRWSSLTMACRTDFNLRPDEPVVCLNLGAVLSISEGKVEAAMRFLEAKERFPVGSESWAEATARAFDMLRQKECAEVAKPEWWNDEGLKALSVRVVRAAPDKVAPNEMRAFVLSGQGASGLGYVDSWQLGAGRRGRRGLDSWEVGYRSAAELVEAAVHFDRAAAVHLHRLTVERRSTVEQRRCAYIGYFDRAAAVHLHRRTVERRCTVEQRRCADLAELANWCRETAANISLLHGHPSSPTASRFQ